VSLIALPVLASLLSLCLDGSQPAVSDVRCLDRKLGEDVVSKHHHMW
jgi:hypothetical protein